MVSTKTLGDNNMPDFLYWSATKIAREIRQGNLTSTEAVEGFLSRIDKVNPRINAVVQLAAERARTEARELDDLASSNRFKGPLHGVPISLKDSLETEGIISTGGTRGRKGFVPVKDATVVHRLRQAGAILLGKTNTPELTLSGETNNAIYGRTNNPYDLEKSPGGSSGGSAAIIAAGGSALELGSDTGGSIREPAHLCGIAGIKPTSGRTPRTGHIVPYGTGVLDSLTQIGPMARYVEDLALGLEVICGPDNYDPSVVPVPLRSFRTVDLSRLRIAFYTHNGVITPCDDIVRVLDQVASGLADDGLRIESRCLPDMPLMIELISKLRRAANGPGVVKLLERYGTTEPGPDLKRYMDNFHGQSDGSVDLDLMEDIDAAKSKALAFMTDYDAILCPPSKNLARPHDDSFNDSYETWSYITVHNLLGWPAAVVRAGTSEAEGLPVAVQVVAAPWREDIALALAAHIESLFGGFHPPQL